MSTPRGAPYGRVEGVGCYPLLSSLTSPPDTAEPALSAWRKTCQYATPRAKPRRYPPIYYHESGNPLGLNGRLTRGLCYTLVIGLIDPIHRRGFPVFTK
jgi:hypothetical protein